VAQILTTDLETEGGAYITTETGQRLALDSFLVAIPMVVNCVVRGTGSHGYTSLISVKTTVQAVAQQASSAGNLIVFSRNTALDITFNCQGRDRLGDPAKGVIYSTALVSGHPDPRVPSITPIYSKTVVSGVRIITITTGDVITAIASVSGSFFSIPTSECWVWTSKIGTMDFTEDLSGEVTMRPMSWSGYVYSIKKLGAGAVVYGNNGIAFMQPSGVVWGLKNIWPLGIMGKNAVVDTDSETIETRNKYHVAIDARGMLLKVTGDGVVTATDYSNYFASLVNPTMVFDPFNNIIHICDGTTGYVLTDSGLGKGPANITGIGYKDRGFFRTSNSAIAFDPLNVCTDIMDFGTRKEKEIDEVHVSMTASVPVYVALDYRWSAAQQWFTTPWVRTDIQGRAFPCASGVEFRVRVKLMAQQATQIDSISLIGKTAEEAAVAA
jgi:hypothetical protein